jgi:4-methoxybenzoate monooxygenase (O-demethylating)
MAVASSGDPRSNGVTAIVKDDRVMIIFDGANRDPRRWENPDRFDVTLHTP